MKPRNQSPTPTENSSGATATTAADFGARSRVPRWLVPLLTVVGAAAVGYLATQQFLPHPVPRALVGKWLAVGGDMDGATLEFQRNGAMIGTVNMKGKEGKISAQVQVEGRSLRITTINPFTKMPETDTQTIRTLEEDRLVLEDHKGTVLKLERLKD